MKRRSCGALLCGVTAIAGLIALGAAPAALAETMTGKQLAARLAKPESFFREGLVIEGLVDLREAGVVRATFECRSCTFTGGIDARHVLFEHLFDLGGSVLEGPLNFESATFAGPLLLGSETSPTRVRGSASFRLASFGDVAAFERTTFRRRADFSFARFRGQAIFTDGAFASTSLFVGAIFDEHARFQRTRLVGDALFDRAHFESTSDFRSAVFTHLGNFQASEYGGAADFGQATFYGVAMFDEARFEQDAILRGATFRSKTDRGGTDALSLGHLVSLGTLDLSAATFWKFVFAESVVAKAVSFDGVSFEPAAGISIGLQTEDVRYPLDQLGHVVTGEQQQKLLAQIESSAKNRGEIRLANDAHYRLQELKAHDYGPITRVLDAVFYRGVAGYFVRPLRPLLVLLVLALVLSMFRWYSRGGSGTGRAATRGLGAVVSFLHVRRLVDWVKRYASRIWGWCAGLVGELFDTIAPVFKLRGGDSSDSGGEKTAPPAAGKKVSRGSGRRLEILIYRILIVCALIGFANSNPTLRDMLDAIVL